MSKPSITTEINFKGRDWSGLWRGELLMYASTLEENEITIIAGANRDDAIISHVRLQIFDCETEFVDACTDCGQRGVPEDHACKAAAA